jgi:hypothetical protein
VITDLDDIDESDKMEEVHLFIKKQGIKDYRDMGFKLFQLYGLDTEKERAKEELEEYEDN